MQLTAKDISERLSSRAEAVAQWLLPNGKRDGAEWCAGSVDGEPGKSLKVHLSGGRAGVWADFAGTDSGDLLDLIVSVKRVKLAEAIKLAKDYLGLRDPESLVGRKSYAKPAVKNVHKSPPESAVMAYLKEQRKLTAETLSAFRISETKNGLEIVFPSFSPEGDLINAKYIALKRDERGKKIVRQEAGCAPSLFGWHAIPHNQREILICEGQIDAMTWKQCGFDALSVPDGVASDEWIDYEWDHLQQFDTIWLAYDADEPGAKASQRVAARLGLHRCMIVKLEQWKDANEALQNGATVDYFGKAVLAAKPISPEKIKTPNQYRDRVVEKFHPPDGVQPGFFPVLFERKIGFRPCEVTIWSGYSSHGKSAVLSQTMLSGIMCGERVAIASMEMRGEQTLHRMLSQAEMNTAPTVAEIDTMLEWLTGKLWIYDLLGNVPVRDLFELMEYSRARHNVTQFVIDSLMKCEVASDDYDGQRKLLNDLTKFSTQHRVHIHLVAHSRKGKDEKDDAGKMDVKGSGDITNQADNILVVKRNKEKEDKRYANKLTADERENMPDTFVSCNKQRENGVEFRQKFLYCQPVFRLNPMAGTIGSWEDLSILGRIKRDNQIQS